LIAEEWPLTIPAYRDHRQRFLYDRGLTARTSSRRMELQPLGYLRTFLKWVSVVLVARARTDAYDRIRHEVREPACSDPRRSWSWAPWRSRRRGNSC
jgi:hypothetical protein